jgi:hypothetical protein
MKASPLRNSFWRTLLGNYGSSYKIEFQKAAVARVPWGR